MQGYNFNLLARLLNKVEREAFTGQVVCYGDNAQIELFFVKGRLQHASDGLDEGDQILYELLNWSKGSFTIQPSTATARFSLDDEQVAIFSDTVQLLVKKGIFLPAEQSPSTPQPSTTTKLFEPVTFSEPTAPKISPALFNEVEVCYHRANGKLNWKAYSGSWD